MTINLNDTYRSNILAVIDLLRGSRKLIVCDPEFHNVMDLLLDIKNEDLVDRGIIDIMKLNTTSKSDSAISTVDEGSHDSLPHAILYLVRPLPDNMKYITRDMKRYTSVDWDASFYVTFIPHRTILCEQILEDNGVHTKNNNMNVTINDLDIGYFQIDSDLLSLEHESFFKDVYIDDDISFLKGNALALARLQAQLGIVPNVRAKGIHSRFILEQYMEMRKRGLAGTDTDNSTSDNLLDSNGSFSIGNSHIEQMIVLDRSIDLVSPWTTPLTYEGMIGESIGITVGFSELPQSILIQDSTPKLTGLGLNEEEQRKHQQAQLKQQALDTKHLKRRGEKVLLPMNTTDPSYSRIRSLSIQGPLGTELQEGIIRIKDVQDRFRKRNDASIQEMHDFVKKLPALQKEFRSLSQHVNIAEITRSTSDSLSFREHWQLERAALEGESVLESIEDLAHADIAVPWLEGFEDFPSGDSLNEEQPDRFISPGLWRCIRLLCIQSVLADGIRSGKYTAIRKLLVQVYGLHVHVLMGNLEKCGLLRRKEVLLIDTSTSIWTGLRQKMQLIQEQEDIYRPKDMSYVTGGYAPFVCRIVQALGLHGTTAAAGLMDVFAVCPGPITEFTQRSKHRHAQSLSIAMEQFAALPASQIPKPSRRSNLQESEKPALLICMLGPLSWVEVACFRHLSRDPAFPYRIIMAASKFQNGSEMMESLADRLLTSTM